MYTDSEWLKIARANAYGMDKMDFADRIAWEPADQSPEEAEYVLALQSGSPHVRIHLDATASGTQVLAALANCVKSGRHCNLFGDRFQDAYTNAWKASGLDFIPRKEFKQAFMTFCFGSRKVPRETLGEENIPVFVEMVQKEFPGVWNALQFMERLWQPQVTSHRWTMPDGFEVIQWNQGLEETVVTLFGQQVTVRRQVPVKLKRGISLLANITHSVDGLICREMVKRAQFDPVQANLKLKGYWAKARHPNIDPLMALWRRTGFLSVDLVNALDQSTFDRLSVSERLEIILMLEHLQDKESFYLVPIHDSFSCEVQHCNDMCKMYRYIMQQVWDSDILASIASDITGQPVRISKQPATLDGVHMIC